MMENNVSVKEEIFSPSEICYDSVFERYELDGIPSRKLSTSSHESSSCNSNCSSTGYSDVSGYVSEIQECLNSTVCNINKGKTVGDSLLVEKNLEQHLSFGQQGKIKSILDAVQNLSDIEKLLLYLKLPTKENEQPIIIANNKQEQTEAFQWIRNNLEECDSSVNLPKHEVYDQYRLCCENIDSKRFLSAPDFGKIVKCLFPNVKARRLGTRGNSKYCYTGLRRREVTKSMSAPDFKTESHEANNNKSSKVTTLPVDDTIDQIFSAACMIVCEWANKLLGRYFTTLVDLARFLVGGSYVSTKSVAALTVMSASQENMNQIKERFTTMSVKPLHNKKETHSVPASVNKSCAPLNMSSTINTPSRTVNGSKPNHASQNVQVVPTTVQLSQVCESQTKIEESKNISGSKANTIKLENFTVDVSSPIILDESSHRTNDSSSDILLLDNVNLLIENDKTQTSFIQSNKDYLGSPSKRLKKKPENLPISNTFKKDAAPFNNSPNSTPPSSQQTTPRKVGRPRGRKNTPVSSPAVGAVSGYHSPQLNRPQSAALYQFQPMFPPQPNLQGMQVNRFGGWPNNQQSPVSFPNIGSPSDMELQAIFIRNQQKTPVNNVHRFTDVQRCQSVPVPQNNNHINMFQPLTPQVNSNSNINNSNVFKAKRNLSFMFNNPGISSGNIQTHHNGFMNGRNGLQINNNGQAHQKFQIHSNNNTNERVVPSMNTSNQIAQPVYENKMVEVPSLKSIGVNICDLATPDDLIDFPSAFDGHVVDSDELLNNLQSTQHMWPNDWSNTSIPVMELTS